MPCFYVGDFVIKKNRFLPTFFSDIGTVGAVWDTRKNRKDARMRIKMWGHTIGPIKVKVKHYRLATLKEIAAQIALRMTS